MSDRVIYRGLYVAIGGKTMCKESWQSMVMIGVTLHKPYL